MNSIAVFCLFIAGTAANSGYGQQQSYSAPQKSSYQQSGPTYQQSAPSYQQSAPSYQQSAPTYQQSAPSYQQPASSYQKSAPSYQQSAPSYQKAAPSYQQSAPSYQQSAPSYGQTSYGQSPPSYASSYNNFIPITSFNQNIRGSQQNDVQFETGNGIRQSESTSVKASSGYGGGQSGYGGGDNGGLTVVKSGSVSYTSPEGIPISLTWVADEYGFRPQGDHLPTPPPIPAEIASTMHLHYGGGGSPYQQQSAPASSY